MPELRPTPARIAALWIAHPATLVAVAVLVFNDHVLKARYGSWWTGKLSDIAGMVVAPALVALAIGLVARHARPTRVAALATVLTGVAFVIVKTTYGGAAAASAAWTAVAGPSVILRDPTDLLALPMLAIAWLAFRSSLACAADASRSRRALTSLAIPFAAAAVLATGSDGYYDATAASSNDVGITVGVVFVDGPSPGSTDWFGSSDGANWAKASFAQTSTHECVPGTPSVCYRIVPGAIGVERSDDAGATWVPEWGLTDAERRRLWLTWYGVPLDAFRSTGVGIADTEVGQRVVVANGLDGFAVRSPQGEWRRAGFEDVASHSLPWLEHPTEIPPPPPAPAPGAIVAGIAWALAAAIATRVVLVGVRVARPVRRAWIARWILAGLGAAGAAACGWFAGTTVLWANESVASQILGIGLAVVLPLTFASWLVGLLAFKPPEPRVRTWALPWGLASGVAALAALTLLPSMTWAGAAAACLVWTAHAVPRLARNQTVTPGSFRRSPDA